MNGVFLPPVRTREVEMKRVPTARSKLDQLGNGIEEQNLSSIEQPAAIGKIDAGGTDAVSALFLYAELVPFKAQEALHVQQK